MTTPRQAGMTAWEALDVLAPEIQDKYERSGQHRFPGGLAYYDSECEGHIFGNDDRQPLLNRLADGSWQATGFRVPHDPSNAIPDQLPAHLWSFLDLDLHTDTASGGGLEYVGLRFHKGESSAAAPSPAVHFGSKKDTQRAYDEHVKATKTETGHAPTLENDKAWAAPHVIPRDRLRELRRASTARTSEDRRRGRRK